MKRRSAHRCRPAGSAVHELAGMRPRDLVEKWGPDTRRNVFLCSGCLLDSRRRKSNSRLVSFWGTSQSKCCESIGRAVRRGPFGWILTAREDLGFPFLAVLPATRWAELHGLSLRGSIQESSGENGPFCTTASQVRASFFRAYLGESTLRHTTGSRSKSNRKDLRHIPEDGSALLEELNVLWLSCLSG